MCRKMKQLHRPGCWLTSWLLLLHILVLSSSSSSIAVSSSSVNDAILDAAAPPATSPNGGAGHEFWKRLQQHRPSPSQSVDIQQQHLIDAAMNMSTQVTARLSDGDVVSCVPINMQPAVVNAKLLKVQLQPTIAAVPRPGNSTRNRLGSRVASQLFALEFGACPAGTIPLRSYTSSTGGASSSSSSSSHSSSTSSDPVQESVRKPQFGNPGLQPAEPTASDNLFHAHAYTVTDITNPPSYKGTEVFINVWEPVVVEPHDFSLAQLWFLNTGLAYPSSSSSSLLNTIEAGWQVYPELYGDDQPRLFIYWTGDAYNQTGCYNLNQGCPAGSPGFVQVSNKVLIGGSISPTSTTDSTQYEFKLLVFKDDSSGNWWLQFNNEYVGYWPDALFNSLKDMGDLIQWGGEILVSSTGSSNSNSNNNSINMGSGDGSSLGYKKAAYQRNLQYVATDNTLHDVCNLQGMAEDPNCFSVTVRHSTQWGSYFYYGGSGFCNR